MPDNSDFDFLGLRRDFRFRRVPRFPAGFGDFRLIDFRLSGLNVQSIEL
jgi:hypothetical protein